LQISLEIPDLKQLRLSVERLKSLGPKLSMQADKKEGVLTMSVESYNVNGCVKFRELRKYQLGEGVGCKVNAISYDPVQ
jgi:hypothetical protein